MTEPTREEMFKLWTDNHNCIIQLMREAEEKKDTEAQMHLMPLYFEAVRELKKYAPSVENETESFLNSLEKDLYTQT